MPYINAFHVEHFDAAITWFHTGFFFGGGGGIRVCMSLQNFVVLINPPQRSSHTVVTLSVYLSVQSDLEDGGGLLLFKSSGNGREVVEKCHYLQT